MAVSLPLLLFAASSTFNSLSARNAAIAEKVTLNGQATTIRRNQEFERRRGLELKRVGRQVENKRRRDTRSIVGLQKTSLARSGVDLDFGTPLEIFGDSEAIGNADIKTIRENTKRQLFESKVRSKNLDTQADQLEAAALNIDPNFEFLTTAIGSAAGFGSKFITGRSAGTGGSSFTRLSPNEQRRLVNVPFSR